jgi:hypothetical protein
VRPYGRTGPTDRPRTGAHPLIPTSRERLGGQLSLVFPLQPRGSRPRKGAPLPFALCSQPLLLALSAWRFTLWQNAPLSGRSTSYRAFEQTAGLEAVREVVEKTGSPCTERSEGSARVPTRMPWAHRVERNAGRLDSGCAVDVLGVRHSARGPLARHARTSARDPVRHHPFLTPVRFPSALAESISGAPAGRSLHQWTSAIAGERLSPDQRRKAAHG